MLRRASVRSLVALLVATLLVAFAAAPGQSEPPLGSASVVPFTDPGDASRPLMATDVDGKTWALGRSQGCVGVAVVFLKVDCPITNGYQPQLARLARAAAESIEFYGVVSDSHVTRREAIRYRDAFKPPFPILFDSSGELRRRLKPRCAPQAMLLSSSGELLYSGAIDDGWISVGRRRTVVRKRYLGEALKQVAAGKLPGTPRTEAIGCPYESETPVPKTGSVTYTRDVAPLIHRHCLSCHRQGEVGPFPLETYEDARRRGELIRQVVTDRQMPPWKPVRGYAHFNRDRSLSDADIELLQKWVAGGTPEGDPDDLPPLPKLTTGWPLGPPDLVLTMPEPFDVPIEGPDPYQHFIMPTGLMENRLVSAVDFKPGNAKVVHHVNFYLDTSGAARLLDAADPRPGYNRYGGAGFVQAGYLGGWTPGVTPQPLPPGLGRPIRKGSDLVLQVHYHTTGKPERDQSQVAIYFAPRTARQCVVEMYVGRTELHIPANDARSEHYASYVTPVDLTLLEVTPHMHLVGREIEVFAELPDRRKLPLVMIKDWDFQWQDHYAYDPPLRIPAGTKIVGRFLYDNSSANPTNPFSPPQNITFGEGSNEEMASVFFRVTTDRASSLDTFIRHNQAYFDQRMNIYLQQKLRQLDPHWSPSNRASSASTGSR